MRAKPILHILLKAALPATVRGDVGRPIPGTISRALAIKIVPTLFFVGKVSRKLNPPTQNRLDIYARDVLL